METLSPDALRERLYKKHAEYIHFMAESFLHDKSLADAVVDLTFLTAFQQIHKLQVSPGVYLKKTAMLIIERCNKTGEVNDG